MNHKKNDISIIQNLFWDYDTNSLKYHLTSPFVIARILELGTPQQFKTFEKMVGSSCIKDFLKTKGKKLLTDESFNFWKIYYKLDETFDST
jgi:hypothetical protein